MWINHGIKWKLKPIKFHENKTLKKNTKEGGGKEGKIEKKMNS